jgi:ankyrin repeat protein
MKRIQGQIVDDAELAKLLLSWITRAKRPLTTSELEHALTVEIKEPQLDIENLYQVEDIVSVCAGLVTIDKESGIIRLVHYTTQEYFDRTWKTWFPNAEANIAAICATYLSFNEFKTGICQNDDEFEQRLQSHKLYHYASRNWGYHAQATSTIIPEVNSFLEGKAQIEASIQALLAVKQHSSDSNYSQRFPKNMTGLHLVAYFGVKAIVQLLLDNGANVNSNTGGRQTPLYWASKNGHVEVAQLLLEKGANINTADKGRATPLYEASKNGHIKVVKLLLKKGADVKAADIYGSTPLHWASWMGHFEAVQLLLEKGADVKAANRGGWTPLHRASKSGHVEVARLLLKKGADVNATDRNGWMPLHWASWSGHVEVAQLLLKNGAVEVGN